MYYAYKYRLKPSDAHREKLDRHRDICRQLYNHTLYRLNESQDEHGELPSMTTLRSELPDLKRWWDGLSDVYSKVLQTVVERLFDNLKGLSALKKNGYGRSAQVEAATGVPQFHVQSVWLQTRQEGRSDCPVTLENRGHTDSAPPRHPRRSQERQLLCSPSEISDF